MAVKPFDPKPLTPGADIIWLQEYRTGERVTRTGQVWALAPQCHASPTVWVIPADGGAVLAVTRLRKSGRVNTQTGRTFGEGETFAENAPVSETGALASAAMFHAYNVRRTNAALIAA